MYDYDVTPPICLQPMKDNPIPRLERCKDQNEAQRWKTRGQAHSYLLSEFQNLCLQLDPKEKTLGLKNCVKMMQKQIFVFE